MKVPPKYVGLYVCLAIVVEICISAAEKDEPPTVGEIPEDFAEELDSVFNVPGDDIRSMHSERVVEELQEINLTAGDGSEVENDEEIWEGEEETFELPLIPTESYYKPVETRYGKDVTYTMPLSHDEKLKLFVMDRVFTRENVDTMRDMLTSPLTAWLYHGANQSEQGNSHYSSQNNAPWTATLSSSGFSSTSLWRNIRGAVDYVQQGYVILQPISVTGYIFQWGDRLTPDLGDENDKSLIVQIYLDEWKRNNFGETLLFHKNGTVAAGIHPRLGRMALFPASTRRLMHPPAIGYRGRQHMLEIRMTRPGKRRTDAAIENRQHEILTSVMMLGDGKAEKAFFGKTLGRKTSTESETNPADFLLKRYTADSGETFGIFDTYLNDQDLNKLRHHIMHDTVYRFRSASSEGEDNVKWKAGYSVRSFLESRLYDQLQKVVNFFTGTTTYYPHDVSASLIRAADHPLMHQNCRPSELDVTLLIYLNLNWTRSMHGETVFYETDKLGDYVSCEAVRPRFGRILAFSSRFQHIVHPPSTRFEGASITFAVKYSPDKSQAVTKLKAVAGSVESFAGMVTSTNVDGVFEEFRQDLSHVQDGVAKNSVLERIDALHARFAAGETVPPEELKELADDVKAMANEDLFLGL